MSRRRPISNETRNMSEETETPKPDAVAGRLDGLVGREKHYGKNCPIGKVQVEFVGAGEKYSDHGWKPTDRAFIEVYIDGKRFRLDVGTFHDGRAERRGIHIVGPLDMQFEKTAVNAGSVFFLPNARHNRPSDSEGPR